MAYQTLLLPPGIQRNATPYDTPGRWWDMNLVRWQAGTLRPIGGWERSTDTPLDSVARGIHMYRDNSNVRHILVGTDSKLYADDGDNFVDVTPSNFTPLNDTSTSAGYGTLDYSAYTFGTARPGVSNLYSPVPFWSFANWGEDVIFTANSDGLLYYYDSQNATTQTTVISGAPTGNTSVVVTDERAVMAIGCGGIQRRVGWSSRESTTDWNFTSTTNTAGFLDVDARTPLTRAVKVREGVLIFSQSEAFLSRYVGLPFIYAIDRIADTTLMSPTSVVAYNGKAVWMGRGGFWKYEGGFLTPLDCPILNDVFVNIDPVFGPRRSHAVHNGAYPEIWFFYPSLGASECDRYVLWNYFEDHWSWGTLSRTAAVSGETYQKPFMGGIDGHIYEHEVGWTNAGENRASTGEIFAETGMLPITDGDKGVHVTNILPANGEGYNSLQIKLYSRQTPEGSERNFGPYHPRPNGYTDCRVTGRDVRLRIEATQDAEWSIGKMRFNVELGTGR